MFDCFECRLRGRTKFGTAATRQLVCLTIAFAACGLSPLSADELTETQKADAPEIESIAVKVKVINAEGEPVAEAKVTPSGMRTRAEPGSHYGWVEARHGKKPAGKAFRHDAIHGGKRRVDTGGGSFDPRTNVVELTYLAAIFPSFHFL